MSEVKSKMFDQHLITLFTQGNFLGHKAWVNSREGAPIVDKSTVNSRYNVLLSAVFLNHREASLYRDLETFLSGLGTIFKTLQFYKFSFEKA